MNEFYMGRIIWELVPKYRVTKVTVRIDHERGNIFVTTIGFVYRFQFEQDGFGTLASL